ncbi:bifunctional serine/threonine-protein kinase/formylglycine-generating enzyme family protein [Cognatilysobacter terrigena]|uniref:bifunctional serine/threonine-protein kinase/formylglycine-generating enzyme family protein n=1 Tax=Cognatilysobacter terrigena TaxID=2488749 RepID=UPI00105DB8B7|nr:bifunctional serine/threonine-protein kinase/formylglycine-generating enzyme family protein [Lysobacter terrigena]
MDDPTPADAHVEPLPQINGYRLLRQLGRGGMSTVYLAEQTALGREVAIKVMAPQALADEVSRRRFENEVRTIARLEHPHIVRIHELGRTKDGLPYYSMPHLARGHLGELDFTRDEAGAVEIAIALLAALEYAHSRGVVHRDVKPENVLFDEAGRPLLADFGIALRRGFGPRVTTAGLAVGSTAYMAPEQARGEDVDGRADLYSLGVVIWEMLAGRLPYEAADALSMALAHAQQPIPKLPAHLRHWQRFMYRALAKSADSRFQTTAEMREAMLAVRPPRWLPAWDRVRDVIGSPAMRWGAGIAAVALLGWGVASVWPRGGNDGFFHVPNAPLAAAPDTEAAPDPTDRMLAPLPGADIEMAVSRGRAQIARNALTTPEGDNALATVLEAWTNHPDDPRVKALSTDLDTALRTKTVAAVKGNDDARARDLAGHTEQLARATGQRGDAPAAADLQKALRTRFDDALAHNDRKRAQQTLVLAKDLRLAPAELTRWTREANRIEGAPRTVAGDEVADLGRGSVSPHPVTRAEYQRFVDATHRPASLCRERASLLRVFAPRTWQSPGFAQGPNDPVVCVSLQDAEAYANWLGGQAGGKFRLPSSSDSSRASADVGGRSISLWLRDCGGSCLERMVTAHSWRGRTAQEPLTANRGYDDVGFRLMRER